MDDTFLTVANIAETLQINQQTIRNWIDRGALPAVRLGRRVRIREADLDRFIQAGATIREAEPADAGAEPEVASVSETEIDGEALALDARETLSQALGVAQAAETDQELASALRELSRASDALADALSRPTSPT